MPFLTGVRAAATAAAFNGDLILACGIKHWIERISHSDRGSQYAATDYRDELAAHRMLASMSGKGDCYDNAVAESVFATLEFELIMRSDLHTREEARRAIFRYIETWCNSKRRHSTLGYAGPAEYEAQQLMPA